MRKSLRLPENSGGGAFFTLKSWMLSYALSMRFAVTVMAVWLAGMSLAQAQFQLLPGNPASPHAAAKTPKPEREPATRGNFPRRMKHEEIEPLFFNNRDFEAAGLGRASFRVTFFRNGVAERLDHKSNVVEQGSWRFLGDGYCSKWGSAYEGCYTIVKDGDTYKVVRGTRAVAFWTPPAADAAERELPAKKEDLPAPRLKKKQRKK